MIIKNPLIIKKAKLQAKIATPATSSQTIVADSNYDGLNEVQVEAVTSAIDSNITPINIRAGVTVLGVAGNLEPDKPDQSKTATPSTSSQTITADAGYELASVTINPVTSAIDSNIQAENIKNGVTILGVTGTLEAIEPEPVTTALNLFDIDGSIITKYNGSETDVIIPVSYSKDVSAGYSDGLYIDSHMYLYLSTVSNYSGSMTFTNNLDMTVTFTSFGTLESDLRSYFPNSCYLIYAMFDSPYAFDFVTRFSTISINGTIFTDGYDAFDYISSEYISTIYFGGATIDSSIIPGTNYSITEIEPKESDAFNGIKVVTILKNITSLKNRARDEGNPFLDNSTLETLIVDGQNPKYKSVTNCIINKTNNALIVGCKNSEIPQGVLSIAPDAFNTCLGLTSITIPDSVTSIGERAFYLCRGLTGTLIIPDNVTSLGLYSFGFCSSLTSVIIGSGITSIANYSFANCTNMTTVTIKATTPPTLSGTKAISSATTKIYIPKGTLSAYRSATNWSNFASKFVELS